MNSKQSFADVARQVRRSVLSRDQARDLNFMSDKQIRARVDAANVPGPDGVSEFDALLTAAAASPRTGAEVCERELADLLAQLSLSA